MVAGGYDIRLGERLEIVIGDRKCVSNVQDIPAQDTLIISAPTFRNTIIPMNRDELVNVTYYRTSGIFSFVALPQRRFTEGNLDLVELTVKSPISKYQRRDFMRLDVVVPVQVRIIAHPENLIESSVETILERIYDRRYIGVPRPMLEGEEVYSALTLDLSGGGLRFVSKETFESNALVECTIDLAKASVTLDGQITRCIEGLEDEGYRVSVRFVNVEERVRRKVIKYIFDEQVRQRRKELNF